MKWSVIVLIFWFNQVQAADDLKQKIQDLDREILSLETLVSTEKNPEVYKSFLQELKIERARYEKLSQKKVQPTKERLVGDPSVSKTIPKAVQIKADKVDEYSNELIPIHERYKILLRELANSYDILSKLREQEVISEASAKFIESEEKRLAEMERLKLQYEIQISELEDLEIAEFKKSGLRVGAMLDLYYQYEFNRADNANPIPNRNYNRRTNDFTLSLVEINVLKSFKNLDLYADFDFGDFAEQNSAHDGNPNTHHIGQAFLRYSFPDFDGVTLTAGKFYTHVGYEVAKAIDNKNYSRSYTFSRGGPFWHEGLAINKSGIGPFGVGLYLYDRSDAAEEDNKGKDYGAQVSFSQNNITSYLNFITGAETEDEGDMKRVYEYNLAWNANSDVTLAFDVIYGQEDEATTDSKDTAWLGLVGYIDYDTSKNVSFCLRVENFKDLTTSGAASNLFSTEDNPDVAPANIMAYTLTNRFNLRNGSELRAEFRLDKANETIYPKKNGKFSNEQSTLTLAWLYSL